MKNKTAQAVLKAAGMREALRMPSEGDSGFRLSKVSQGPLTGRRTYYVTTYSGAECKRAKKALQEYGYTIRQGDHRLSFHADEPAPYEERLAKLETERDKALEDYQRYPSTPSYHAGKRSLYYIYSKAVDAVQAFKDLHSRRRLLPLAFA